jgi:uncharacterized membrane protein YhhN
LNPIQMFLFYVNRIKGGDHAITRRKTIVSYFILKMTLSAGVLLVAMTELRWYGDSHDCMFVIPGLLFCTAGDITLFLSNEYDIELKEPYFTMGILSFGFAHIMFCADLLYLADFRITPAVGMALVTVAMVLHFSRRSILELGRYKIPLVCYALLVGTFCGLGINLLVVHGLNRQVFMIGVGAMIFWLSDLSLSFRCFNKKVPDWFGTFVFTSYFIATYMVALSLRGY